MGDLKRNKTESIKDYKIRLFKNKKEYKLTNIDIANLINKETGKNYTESVYRKWFKAYKEGYEDFLIHNNDTSSDNYLEKLSKLEKEKIKLLDQRREYKELIRKKAREEEVLDIIKNTINCFDYNKNKLIINKNEYNKSNKCMIVCLNDIHYGIEIKNNWNVYNSEIAKKRIEKYIQKIMEIKKHNNIENCYVFSNGDLISGNIHHRISISNKENVIEQIIGVSELLSNFCMILSENFNNVYLSVVAGNHSRISKKEDSPIYERLDNIVPWYISAKLQNIKNFKILKNNIDNTFNLVNIMGKNYLNVHGDMDSFSNIQKLISMVKEDVYCIHFGHKHHNKTDWIDGYKLIMSGSLMGMDDFCVEKRIYGYPQQLICLCDENGIESTYDIIFE